MNLAEQIRQMKSIIGDVVNRFEAEELSPTVGPELAQLPQKISIDSLPRLTPPLSRTVIEGREEKPLSPSRERASGISRYRGHLDHLAGRDPDELMHEIRGQ